MGFLACCTASLLHGPMAVFSAVVGVLVFLQPSAHGCLESGPWLLPEFMLTWRRPKRGRSAKGLAEAATCQVGPDKSPGPLQVRGAGAVRTLQMLRERSMCHKQELALLDYSWRLCDPSTQWCSGGLQAGQPPQLSPQLFGHTAVETSCQDLGQALEIGFP